MSAFADATDTAVFDAAIAADRAVIAKFQSEACVICRKIEPMLAATANRLADKVTVIDVDAEKNPDLAVRYNIRGLPTLVLFRGGAELSRCTGFQTASMLRDWVGPHLEGEV